MKNIFVAIKLVLSKPKYFLVFIVVAIVFFLLFLAIPVYTIPGNSFGLQLSIFRGQDYVLMIFLALLVGLNAALHMYSRQQNKKIASQNLVRGAATGTLGIFGAVVGTAACASCLASLFGMIGLGVGGVFFVLKYQPYFLVGAIILMFISLYLAVRNVNKACASCQNNIN